MSIIGTIHEDVVTDVLGEIGAWQWMVTLVSTVLMMSAMFNQNKDMFLLHPSQVTCVPPGQLHVTNYSLCYVSFEHNQTETLPCTKWQLKLLWIIWIRKSWLVFCDHKVKLLTTAIISHSGFIFGYVIFGLVSDNCGRRLGIAINAFVDVLLGMIITICDSEGWFRLLVFLKSLFGSANLYMGLILISEIASNDWRSWLLVIAMTPRLLATVCMVVTANSAPNHETYSLMSCLHGIICIVLLRWVPESPQWLLYNRKIEDAEKILLEAAKKNGINLCQDFKIRPVSHRAYSALEESTRCLGILTTHNIKVTCIVACLFWILLHFLWSSLYVRVYSEEDINNVLQKVVCFVGVFGCLTIVVTKQFTLNQTILVHVIITGAATACFTFFTQELRIILSSIALASGIIAHALLLNISVRLFAINIRATMFGCCLAIGQLGEIISYLIYLFYPLNDSIILVVTLAITVSLAALSLIFPIVDGRELPDTMEDMDYYRELSKPLRWATQKTNSPSREEVEMRVYSFGSGVRNYSLDRLPAERISIALIWSRFYKTIRRCLLQ